jgi:hypothetical protein
LFADTGLACLLQCRIVGNKTVMISVHKGTEGD